MFFIILFQFLNFPKGLLIPVNYFPYLEDILLSLYMHLLACEIILEFSFPGYWRSGAVYNLLVAKCDTGP